MKTIFYFEENKTRTKKDNFELGIAIGLFFVLTFFKSVFVIPLCLVALSELINFNRLVIEQGK